MSSDLLKKFFTYGLGNVLQSALSLILLPLYLHYLRPDEYGVISVLSVSMSLLTLTVSAGMMNGLIRLYYEVEGLSRKRLIGMTWLWYLTVGACGAGILLTQAKLLSLLLFRVSSYANSIRVVGAAFFFLMAQIVPFYILRLEKKAGQYVVFSLIGFLIDFILKLYFIVTLGRGIEGYFASSAIANMLTLCLMLPFVSRNMKISFDAVMIRQLLKLGAPYIFSGIAVWTIDVSDRLLLNHFSGEAAVGVYSVAYNFANIFRVLLATPAALLVDPYFFAFAAAKPTEETIKLLQKMLIYSFLAGAVLYLGIALSSGDVLRVLITHFGAKQEYQAAASLVSVITLAPLLYFLVMPSILGGLWVKRPEIFSAACVWAACLNAGLNFFMIPRYGALGAAITTVLAYLLLMVLSYGRLEYYLKGGYGWIKVSKILLFLGTGFMVASFIRLDHPIASLLLRSVVGVAVFIAATILAKDVVTKIERDAIFQLLRKVKTIRTEVQNG